MRFHTSLCSIAALLTLSQAAAAADGDTFADVCIRNASGLKVELTTPPSTTPVPLAGKGGNYEVSISDRETLRISACAINPVLFTYGAGQQTTTPLPDVAAGTQFAGAIGAIVKALAPVTTGPNTVSFDGSKSRSIPSCKPFAVTSVQGVRLEKLEQNVASLDALYNDIPAAITATHDPASDRVGAEKTKFAEGVSKLRELRSSLAGLTTYAMIRAKNGKPVLGITDEDGVEKTYQTQEEFLKTAAEPCREQSQARLEAQLGGLDFLVHERTTLLSMLDTVEAFHTTLDSVNASKELATVAFDSKNRRSQPIIIATSSTFSKFYDAATKQFVADASKVGTVTVNVEPKLNLRLGIAPGIIYSFVKQPKFSAKSDGSGQFTISQELSEYSAAAGVVALNLTKDKYLHENARPFFQIGVAPKKDERAFLLGAGISLNDFNNAVISAGAIFQERRKLGGGQTVGASLAKAEDLKVDTEFKVGFYVGLSYNVTATK